MKNTFIIIFVAFFSGIAGAFTFQRWISPNSSGSMIEEKPMTNTHLTNHREISSEAIMETSNKDAKPLSRNEFIENGFANASEKSTKSVVFIKTLSGPEYGRGSWLDWFFEGSSSKRSGSGSGVIFREDGYIITNNHVIDGAEVIEVIHGKNTFEANVVGTDPSSDIAVLKVESNNLPAIELGNSRELAVGEWVLAVGNPFNLTSTVTAGIVSAKGRDINILKGRFPLESFIQTDAAINPGNSGGALVNQEGQLVGINTAILSKTGSYAGYGFAVPVDIVRKVADDLILYGETQKAFLGAEILDLTPEIAEAIGATSRDGVVVGYVQENGAADKAGFKKGDVITAINNFKVDGKSSFDEQLSYYSPGDEVSVRFKRKDKEYNSSLILTNREGTTDLVRKVIFHSEALGVDFETVSQIEKAELGIKSGVKVGKIRDGFFRKLGISEGFIITGVNNREIKKPEELSDILENISGRVRIEGVNTNGIRGYYTFYF